MSGGPMTEEERVEALKADGACTRKCMFVHDRHEGHWDDWRCLTCEKRAPYIAPPAPRREFYA